LAIYFINMKTFGRSGGSSAPAAAAYRSGERIRDERTGRVHDHTDRQDVMHKEIVLPSRFADLDMSWATDRSNLWNHAEAAEARKNARVAREYLVALPHELSQAQQVGLVRQFAQEISERFKAAVDLAVHAPREFPGSDPRNFHAHLLSTTREVSSEGLTIKTAMELSDAYRRSVGLGPTIEEWVHLRERWAVATNDALREASIDARVDHRSLEAQGIHREPKLWIPRVAFELERRGYRSELAEAIREDQRAREMRERVQTEAPASQTPAAGNIDDVRRQARENWIKFRQGARMRDVSGGNERAPDDDLSR
jgi:ATP-dependent exoDNAse (exonuclease V) alpha subunit